MEQSGIPVVKTALKTPLAILPRPFEEDPTAIICALEKLTEGEYTITLPITLSLHQWFYLAIAAQKQKSTMAGVASWILEAGDDVINMGSGMS